ncbi:universal stress protein UspA [Mycolicibacterium cyprinidarum]|uniref:Universal stress protein UspA n=1 Tax=Mycolicibacterium cyprinidarum TaxID=2860311 RepID=A0ABQ4V7T3_9MYCO|nr:universal stress protein UspA [Mycolicibacterium sp. NGTWSNA01]
MATPSGEDGLELGIRLARTVGAQLDIVIVLPPDRVLPGMVPIGGYEEILTERANEWLQQAAARVPEEIETTTHVVFNESFAQGLLTEAERLDAEVIVVGAAGDGLIGRHSIGSVTGELLHCSTVPLALAPRGLRDSTVERVRDVTLAIGTRPGDGLALDTSVLASRAAGTPLRLVSLVALDPIFGSMREEDGSLRDRAHAHARLMFDAAKAVLPEGFPVTSTITDGSTIEEAVNKLEWHEGDLIVVGSSRLAPPRRLFLGSTAAKMLRVLEVPMIVIPRPETASDAEEEAQP